jgi:HPt (histidine-containing phosphotransfer) domain-containing protein
MGDLVGRDDPHDAPRPANVLVRTCVGSAASVIEPLLSTYADDPEMGELIGMFVGELPKRLAELEASAAAHDCAALARLAHQIKGAAGGYGYGSITDAARALETLARESAAAPLASAERVRAVLDELTALCGRAVTGLQRIKTPART